MRQNNQEKICQIALSMIKGVGCKLFQQLLNHFGSAATIFDLTEKELRKTPGIGVQIAKSIAQKDSLQAEKLFQQHTEKGIEIISYQDPTYPERLRHTSEPPIILYASNKIDFNCPKMVSIVGTRKATPYGKEMVEKILDKLSAYDILVVSGLAYGIDIHAHEVALANNLPTVGVVAGGLDEIYPSSHAKTAQKMTKNGALISEYTLGTQPKGKNFIIRNRIIAGLSDLTIVVEASKKSGALTTAIFANEYNREVFAFPGHIGKSSSEGCNNLIKNHMAHIVTDFDDVAYSMNWVKNKSKNKATRDIQLNNVHLTKEEENTIQALRETDKAMDVNKLSKHMQMSVVQLADTMLQLELKNIVQRSPGNKYQMKNWSY